MSMNLIQIVLSAELTAIPAWMRATFKGHVNNTLCNGAMWMLVLWKIVHILYTALMHRCLKRMGTKQYIRTRLTNSLWYCGFFSSALAYTLVTFDRNEMDLLLRGNHVTLNENLPTQVIVAYTVMCTFFLHTALSEGIQCGSWPTGLKYIILVAVCISAFMLRVLEIPFCLAAVIGICAISEEITKIFHSLLKQDKFVRTLYLFNVVLFTFMHFLVIPVIFLIPLGKMIRFDTSEALLILVFSSLLLWLCSAIYNSIIFNAIVHWLYHTTERSQQEEKSENDEDEVNKETIKCPLSIIECSLFSIRTDDAYLLHVLRSQIRERKKKMDAKKKPRGKNLMLIQTLKCVMAIRKKLNQKKKSENFDSDDNSENEEDTEDDNAAEHETLHIEKNESESKLEMDEVKIENKNEATENLDVGITDNLNSESSIDTDETTDSDFKNSLGNKVLQTVEDSNEESADITATVETTPGNASDPKNSQDDQVNKPTCDVTKDSLNTKLVVGNTCAGMSEITTQSIEREISSESISDDTSLNKDNGEESGKVKEEKSSVKISASFKKSSTH